MFSGTFYAVEMKRQLRNPFALVFTLGMPIAMYLLFGAGAEYGSAPMGKGNVAFYVMVSMAAFGTAVAMTSVCSFAASEVRQGWGRQIAVTPMPMLGYAAVKLATALTFSIIVVVVVGIVGWSTGARADDAWRWALAALIILTGGVIFGVFGLGVGLTFNADSASSLASIAVTFFAFFGNVFMPLEGTMLSIAQFTPMYGYVSLVRWPITEGTLLAGGSDNIWLVLGNIAIWAILFAALCLLGIQRSRRRR